MTEEQYRKTIVVILITIVRLMAIFISAWAESQYKIMFDKYRDDAWKTYIQLEAKVLESL